MKFNAILLTLAIGLLFTSCKKDEESLDGVVLAGEIEGKTFTVGSAIFTETTDEFSFDIYNAGAEIIDSCSTNSGNIRAFFDSKKTTDKQKLDFDLFSLNDTYTITLFDPADFNNIIVSDGYFKINEISDDVIMAEMDIKSGSDNYLKGQFIAYKCN